MSNILSYRFRFALSAVLLFIAVPLHAIKFFGAGVLPYAIDPKTNKVYVLFSREAFGNDRGTWADFGGGAEVGDRNDPVAIAAREFHEESIGLFGSFNEGKSFLSKSSGVRSYQVRRKHRKDAYAFYFAKVGYDKNIDRLFQRRLARAHAFKNREKDELVWISVRRLQWCLNNNSSVVKTSPGRLITIRPSTFKTLQRNGSSFIDQLARGHVPHGNSLRIK